MIVSPNGAAALSQLQHDPDMTQSTDAKPLVIKKYANRRLYNMAASKYIVLQDVIDLVNDGTEFVIEDAKTGEDITRTILNQIIFEQETRPQEFMFPLEFQKQLIRMYSDAYKHMVPDFLTKSMDYFTAERAEMAQAWQEMMAKNAETFMRQSTELARQNMELFRRNFDFFGMMDGDTPTQDDNPEPAPEGNALGDLQDQINALQDKLKDLSKRSE